MTPPGSVFHWLRTLVRNTIHARASDADLRDNVHSYVDLLTEEKIAAGMAPDAAHRAALLEFGGVDTVTEQTREARAGAQLAQVWQDARYAMRIAWRDWSFSGVAVLTLALGIGANTAIFSVVNAVLLKPLPYRDPDRLVLLWERNASIGKARDPVAPLNFQDWRTRNTVLEHIGAYRFRGFALSGVETPERVDALAMSGSVFRVLDVNALVGRSFTEEEERRGDRVVVLAHEFWQRRFGGDRTLVGRSITLNGASFTVVGVMPPGFAFPDGNPVDVYAPLVFTQEDLNGRGAHTLAVIGRLKKLVSVEEASADIGRIARSIAAEDPRSNPDVTIAGAHNVLVEDVRLGLLILLGTVGFVLLIACGNIANLLLVRAASRRREMAIRAALGATRRRLLRQLLTESLLLAAIGGAVGVLVAWGLLQLFVRINPPDFARVDLVAIDPMVLLFAIGIAMVTGVVFGIAPALRVSQSGLTDATKTGGYHTTAAFRRNSGRSMLLVAEIALSLMLLAGAGLMIRSLAKAQTLDLGFRTSGVLTGNIFLPAAKYPVDSSQFRPRPDDPPRAVDSKPSVFFAQLEERLSVLPGVQAVGAVSSLPLNPVGLDFDLPVIVQGRPRPRGGEEPQADFRLATTGYFRTMGIPLLKGRAFTEFDGPNSAPVVVINDTTARQMFPGEDPLGRQIVLYSRPREIVGVVGSVRHHGFSRDARPEMILPYRQFQFGGMTLVVRSALNPADLGAAVERTVQSLDPDLPVSGIRTMDDLLADSVAQPRFTTMLLAGFACLALTLALVGVYGVMSYAVSQRTREIAVRMALGAHRQEVVWMIVRQGMVVTAIGVIVGLGGAAAGTRVMAGLLFDVTATDPPTFAAAAAALVLASFGACYIPALRAARVAPVTILKSE